LFFHPWILSSSHQMSGWWPETLAPGCPAPGGVWTQLSPSL
jgi:hypothetical protein